MSAFESFECLSRRFGENDRINHIVPQHGRRYTWFCSQFHTRAVFAFVQLLMIIFSLSSLICLTGFLANGCPKISLNMQPFVFFTAVSVIASVLLGFTGMRFCELVHRLGSRICKHPFPPALLLIPSYMSQVGLVFLIGLWTAHRIIERFQNFQNKRFNEICCRVIMTTVIPLIFLWITIIYVLVASFDYAFYASRKSRYWQRRPPRPAFLTSHNFSTEFDSWSNEDYLKFSNISHRSGLTGHLESLYKNRFTKFHKEGVNESDRYVTQISCIPNTARCGFPVQNISELSVPSGNTSRTVCECVQMLNAHVSPVKRELETVLEESKSQTSGETVSLK